MAVYEPARGHHPIFGPEARDLTEGAFSPEEVRLANRNSGTLLETLRYDLTPTGLHYLLIHFDVPYTLRPMTGRSKLAGWSRGR